MVGDAGVCIIPGENSSEEEEDEEDDDEEHNMHGEDSDSDGPVLYKDEDSDEDEEDEPPPSKTECLHFHGHCKSRFVRWYFQAVLHTRSRPRSGALASRVKRKDTLALKLSSRPCAPDRDRFIQERSGRDEQPPGQTGLTWQSREQWEAIRTQIGTALTR